MTVSIPAAAFLRYHRFVNGTVFERRVLSWLPLLRPMGASSAFTQNSESCSPYPSVKDHGMSRVSVLFSFYLLGFCSALAEDPPANSEVALQDSFDRTEPGKGWHPTTGEWQIFDGVLRGREIAAEKHSAATRRILLTENAVYQCRFRFIESGKTFHFGFDPAKGELDKKGHLLSIVVNRDSWSILKHVDKNRPKEDPNETLAEQKTEFKVDEWYSLRVTTWGAHVTAAIEGKEPLKASHPTFGVKKPTLVFRCIGSGVEIDDIEVWRQKE
jgi:hypothetical protein